jgi:hypothetical protein
MMTRRPTDGFVAFGLLQQKDEAGRSSERRPPGPSAVGKLQSALGLRPRRALSSAGAKGGFPVSVSLGVYRAGNGQWQFELITTGVTNDLACGGELGQGGADVGGAHATEFLQLLDRDRFLHLGQGLEYPLGRRERSLRLNRGWVQADKFEVSAANRLRPREGFCSNE